jgi:hypothetical protein
MEKPSELQIGKIVSQLTFPQLKSVLIHLGLSNSEIETIQFDNQGNIQNIMFLCLPISDSSETPAIKNKMYLSSKLKFDLLSVM